MNSLPIATELGETSFKFIQQFKSLAHRFHWQTEESVAGILVETGYKEESAQEGILHPV